MGAFCEDTILEESFRRLIKDYGVKTVIETGTWEGWTTEALAGMADMVYTVEKDINLYLKAKQRLAKIPNVGQFHGDSVDVLASIIGKVKRPTLYFLDAHWGRDNPLLKELDIIARYDPAPIIVIHDMKVPDHPELKYDVYGGQAYCYEWVAPVLEAIKTPWHHYYNTDATGQKVGVLFVVPIKAFVKEGKQ